MKAFSDESYCTSSRKGQQARHANSWANQKQSDEMRIYEASQLPRVLNSDAEDNTDGRNLSLNRDCLKNFKEHHCKNEKA